MTGLYIALGVVAALILIGLIPVGAEVLYDGENPSAFLTVLFLRFKLFPKKKKHLTEKQRTKAEAKAEKKRKAKEEKKKKAEAEALTNVKEKKTLKEKIDGLLPFANLAVKALGTVRRKLLIKRLLIHMQLGGGNAAKTAETCGYAWAAAAATRNLLGRAFRIRKSDVQIWPDFAGGQTKIRAELSLRFLLIDLLALAVNYGCKALAILIKQKRPAKQSPEKTNETKKAVRT